MTDFVVVTSHPQLLSFVDALQRKNAESLSFYPRQVFEREAERGRIFLGLLNGQPCGYLYAGAVGQFSVKCHQVCIEYDARHRLYGASLVVAVEDYASRGGAPSVTLRCGFDLEANEFWKSLNYQCVGTQPGGIRRNRTINLWRKDLRAGLFETIGIEPAVGRTSATIWSAHKETGLITQFARGRQLREYRAVIEKAARTTKRGQP